MTSQREIIDALPRAVVVTDPAGQIELWNAQAESLFGWAEAEVLGRSVVEVLAPVEDLATNEKDLAIAASGQIITGDRIVMRRSGEPVRVLTFTRPIVDESGRVTAIVGASEEVTELRLAEQRARDVSEHFRLALQAGELGTWRWEMLMGTTSWDPQLEALFGLAPGTFDGRFETYVSLLHPDDREHVLQTVAEAVENDSTYRVEHRVVWPDGSVHWLSGAGGVTHDDRGEVTGTVGCSMDITARVINEHELASLAHIAAQAAEGERLQRERLEFLGAINEALNEASNTQELMASVTKAAVPRLGDWCAIHVVRPDSAVPDVVVNHVDPAMVAYARQLQEQFPYDPRDTTGVPNVIRTGQTEFYPDINDEVMSELDATTEERDIVAQLALRSAITVPLIKRGKVIGAIQFVMAASSRHYTEDDVTLAQTVAGRVASSVENHRLNAEQRDIAHTLQRSLLPDSIPNVPHVEIAVRYRAAGEGNEVGGDFYDVFSLEHPGLCALVIGDVCGKGPAAAALTGLARHTIRASAWHGDDATDVLTSLNRAMRRGSVNSFLTAVYAVLDTSETNPQITVACAGHPLPIHVSSEGSRYIGAHGTLLGPLDDIRVDPRSTTLEVGDVVVFYTDGATDLRPPFHVDEAAFAALVQSAAEAGSTSEEIADHIVGALDAILSFDRRSDDIALLVLRIASSR